MELLRNIFKNEKRKPRNLWKIVNNNKYQYHATISSIDSITRSKEIDDEIIYLENLEKRKEVYGICGECNEPGTGYYWCQPCNAKRFRENFKDWTSGNKDIDELIQFSQLNALHRTKCLEWIPYENFRNVTYVTKGGFGKIYSAEWPEGHIWHWDIENQEWRRSTSQKVALKSLDNSSKISADFLNEIRSHLQIYFWGIIYCYGITQNPKTNNYMMVLYYCERGNLRNYYLKKLEEDYSKLYTLSRITRGLLDIHNAEKIHKDLHLGNILFGTDIYVSDLGMCQPANKHNEEKSNKQGVYGVLPYIAPEVLRGYQYTKAADIYSFGIVMNEYLSEEMPFNDIPHDEYLAIQICKGLRPKIFESTPKFLVDLIMKCWDAKAENRPSAKDLFQTLKKWTYEEFHGDIEIKTQMGKFYKISINKLKNNDKSNKNKFESITTHPQAIYTSRLFNFENLPEPVNSSDLSSFQFNSECLDCKIEISYSTRLKDPISL